MPDNGMTARALLRMVSTIAAPCWAVSCLVHKVVGTAANVNEVT